MDNVTYTYSPDGPETLPDDGHRYDLTTPAGFGEIMDKLNPIADHHTIRVYGSADLARRLQEANEDGVCVAFQRVDDDAAEA